MVEQSPSRIPITEVEDISTSQELDKLLDTYPDIDEIEFEALTPFVMQYYLESYRAGNPMDMEGEVLRYLSKRFILVGTKLGCATDFVKDIITENMPILKEFREQYKPFDSRIDVKYENPGTNIDFSMNDKQMVNNIFLYAKAQPHHIETFLTAG